MSQKFIKSALLVTSSFLAAQSFAQDVQSDNNHNATATATVSNGSFSLSLRKQQVSLIALEADFNKVLGLTSDYSFTKVKERMDKRGVNHISYQQYYKGIKVDGGVVLVHVKNGLVASFNGIIATPAEIATKNLIAEETAYTIAKKELDVVSLLNSYPAELVITPYYQNKLRKYAFAYKLRIDGKLKGAGVAMYNVYVNADNGSVIKKVSLVNNEDVEGTAHTVYNGTRTITTDNFEGGYRLRDNARKIETYDAGGLFPFESDTEMFVDPRDLTNETTTWEEKPTLMSMSMDEASETFMTGMGSENIFTGIVGAGESMDFETIDLVTSPDFRFSVTSESDLPVVSKNQYVQITNPPYVAGFASLGWDFETLADTAYTIIEDATIGIHDWSDAKGNSGTYEIKEVAHPALDAHWGMGETHDYYSEIFGRNSYDGEGAVVKNYINGLYLISLFSGLPSQNNAAAYPDPYNAMVYGMGDGEYMGPVVGLDVMGHEFTHLVTNYNGHGGLDYEGESGALNESFSDIFGTCIEFYAKGDEGNFTIGEDVVLTEPFFMRSMSAPKVVGYPDTYLGEFWIETSSTIDNGGVHINSSVPNKWFYLMCQGGEGVNDNDYAYNVTAIGMEKAEQIAYLTLTEYLSSSSAQFIDAYNGSLEAAAELFGEDSPEYTTVEKAWRAVGVPENDPSSINNNSVAAKSVKVYPNPSTGKIIIDSRLDKNAEANVYSIVGTHVMNTVVKPGANDIDLSGLSKGIYMIKFAAGKDQFVQKVILK